MRILLVFGTRPEAIKMAPLIWELRRREGVRAFLLVTGQHREMLQGVMDAFGLVADRDLAVMRAGQSLTLLTSRIALGVEDALLEFSPDLVVVHGDTTTAFAASLVAFYRGIRVAHIEAGLRTRDLRSPFPEEYNRRAISLIADFHFAPTAMARENLVAEGVALSSVYLVGNTVVDALSMTVCDDFAHPLLDFANGSRLIVLTAHRRENLGETMALAFGELRRLLKRYPDVKVIFPMHKNPLVREVAARAFADCERVCLTEPLDVRVFHNLLARAFCIVSDSGGIQEEATALGKPLLLLRDTTERPEGVASGVLKLVGASGERLFEDLSLLLENEGVYRSMAKASGVYGDGKASEKIADILLK